MRPSALVAVFVALAFLIGITECKAFCLSAEPSATQTDSPCHEMGHDMGHGQKPTHSSCPRAQLLAEQTASVHVPAVVLHAEPIQAVSLIFTLSPKSHFSLQHFGFNPPGPPRSTTVLLI